MSMCLSRGICQNLFDNHGDPRNITMQTIQDAANAAGITVPEALGNIQRGVSIGLTGMTDWTGAQDDEQGMAMDRYFNPLLSSTPPSPSPGERSPGS